MTIDFENVNVYADLKHEQCVTVDLKEQFAELVYQKGTGIQAHALALKIFNGDKEFDEKEVNLIKSFTDKFCTPMIIDAIHTLCKQ